MNIVYLHQYFTTPDMAGGTRSYEMAHRLVNNGHTVHMITSTRDDSGQDDLWRTTDEGGIHVHWTPVPYNNAMSFNERIKAFFAFAWRASRKAATFDPDVFFATSTPLTIAIPAVYAARRAGRPMVFEVRDLWPAVPISIGALRNPIAKKAALQLEKFAYRNSKRIVALAPGMKEHVVETGYPADQVEVIPNGSDVDFFSVDDQARQDIRSQYPWLGDNPLVLFAGTLGFIAGVGYLAEIAAVCREKAPNVRFALIGDGKEREPIRQQAEKLGVLDKNFFILGAMPKKAVPPWLAAADLMTAFNTGPRIVWKDAVQNKFFDSLAASRPIACNYRGWSSEIAEKADAGIIIDAKDPALAADQILKALHDRAWLKQAGANARRLGEEQFNRDILANQLETVLLEAAA